MRSPFPVTCFRIVRASLVFGMAMVSPLLNKNAWTDQPRIPAFDGSPALYRPSALRSLSSARVEDREIPAVKEIEGSVIHPALSHPQFVDAVLQELEFLHFRGIAQPVGHADYIRAWSFYIFVVSPSRWTRGLHPRLSFRKSARGRHSRLHGKR